MIIFESLTAVEAIQRLDTARKEAEGKTVQAEITLRDRVLDIEFTGTRLTKCIVRADGHNFALRRKLDLHDWKNRLWEAMVTHKVAANAQQ